MNQEFITTALFSQNKLSNNTQRLTDQKNYHNHRAASAFAQNKLSKSQQPSKLTQVTSVYDQKTITITD